MSNLSGSTEVEFIMRRYPGRAGSEAAAALEPGEVVHIEMPYGDMWVRDTHTPVCLVASGTGIAPILGMSRRLAGTPDSRPVRVIYGANIRDELVCWDKLDGLVRTLPDAELIGALTSAHDGWNGVQSLVTHAVHPMLSKLSGADFYIAGPPATTNAVRQLLVDNGIQLDRIRYDSFG